MTKPVPGIKIPYFKTSLYPTVEGTRCLEIRIPDDDSFVPLIGGMVRLLARSFYWEGPQEEKYAKADMWRAAYDETDWEGCVNCEDLTECIQPLLDAQTEQFQTMLNLSKYGDANPVGVPLDDETRNADQAAGTNPTCDLDVTWAQSLQIVQYGNQLITDALELAESATNDTELAGVISDLPGIDELGADAIFAYIDLLLEGIAENYEAQYTQEYEQQTACAIFCLATANCEISLEDIYSVFYDRVTDRFGTPAETISTLVDLLAYLIDQDIDGTIVADVLMLVIFGGGVLANIFLGDVGTKSLQVLLKLAVNDASSDWEILCSECSTEQPIFANIDVPGNDTGFDVVDGTDYALNPDGTWDGGAGTFDARGDIGNIDPAAIMPTANLYRMVYRIGTTGAWLATDDTFSFTAPDTGRLYLACNDETGAYGDNSGAIDVTIMEI